MSNLDEILTVRQVADYFKVNPKTVTNWIIREKLVAFKTLGGHYRLRREDVENAFEKDRERRPGYRRTDRVSGGKGSESRP